MMSMGKTLTTRRMTVNWKVWKDMTRVRPWQRLKERTKDHLDRNWTWPSIDLM